MNEILTINYESENPTVSARELHEKLHIDSNFTTWFKRMCEYGFEEGKDFFPKLEESTGGRPSKEFERLNHKFCGISDSSRSSVGSYRIASERNIRHQDIRIPVCEES